MKKPKDHADHAEPTKVERLTNPKKIDYKLKLKVTLVCDLVLHTSNNQTVKQVDLSLGMFNQTKHALPNM